MGKQPLVLPVKEVWQLPLPVVGASGGVGLVAGIHNLQLVAKLSSPLAAVAGKEAAGRAGVSASCSEGVDGHQAVVVALAAATQLQLHVEGVQLLQGGDVGADGGGLEGSLVHTYRRANQVLPLVQGDEGRTIGTHETRHVRTEDIHPGNLFEGPQNRIVVKGSTLHYNLASNLGGTAQLDDLEQCVLDD